MPQANPQQVLIPQIQLQIPPTDKGVYGLMKKESFLFCGQYGEGSFYIYKNLQNFLWSLESVNYSLYNGVRAHGKGEPVKYPDRSYLRKCRVSAVGRAARSRLSYRRGRRRRGLILGTVLTLELLWAAGALGQLSQEIRSLVQVQRIREKIPSHGGNPFAGPGETGKARIKEGVNILLDENAISIFRIRESAEEGE